MYDKQFFSSNSSSVIYVDFYSLPHVRLNFFMYSNCHTGVYPACTILFVQELRVIIIVIMAMCVHACARKRIPYSRCCRPVVNF